MIKIRDFLYQIEESLYCTEICFLTLSLEDYTIGYNLIIDENANTIYVDSLLSKIYFEKSSFDLILDYPVILNYETIEKRKEDVKIYFGEDSKLLEVPTQKQDIREIVLYLERLLGGREKFKDIEHLFLKFYNMYSKEISNMDLVHMEILISQILRDKNNASIPARVGSDPEHPQMANIKQHVFNTGFFQGLAFENIGKAISTGLISTTELEPSILEKVLSGTLAKEKII